MHSYQWFRRFVEIEGPTDEYGVRKRGVLPSQDRFNHPTSGAQEELCLDMGFLQVTPVSAPALQSGYSTLIAALPSRAFSLAIRSLTVSTE